jgi:hypothetical protein
LLDRKQYSQALECYRQMEQVYSPAELALIRDQLSRKKEMASQGTGKAVAAMAMNALRNHDQDTALFLYDQARQLLKEIPGTADARLDSLLPAMSRIRSGQLVEEGAAALEKRQYNLAVSLFREARNLATENGFVQDRSADSLYRQAMKHYLVIQLSASQKKIWANEFDSAQAAVERTEAQAYDFGLLLDPEIVKSMENYKTKILEQQCRNIQDSVTVRLIRSERSMALGNYINGTTQLEEALRIARSNPACNINEKPMQDTLDKYSGVSAYLVKMKEINTKISLGQYPGAIASLQQATADYRNGNLAGFGIPRPDIYLYIRDKANPHLIQYTVTLFASLGKYPDVILYVTLLEQPPDGSWDRGSVK